ACWYCFFQAEDGIRARNVTGVQTCALPIGGGGTCSLSRAQADQGAAAGAAGPWPRLWAAALSQRGDGLAVEQTSCPAARLQLSQIGRAAGRGRAETSGGDGAG